MNSRVGNESTRVTSTQTMSANPAKTTLQKNTVIVLKEATANLKTGATTKKTMHSKKHKKQQKVLNVPIKCVESRREFRKYQVWDSSDF